MAAGAALIALLTRLGAALLVIYGGCIGVALAAGTSMPKETLLFTSSRANGTYNLYLLDMRVGIVRKLSDFVVDSCCPVWSPDGENLLLPSGGMGDFKLYLMDWDGSDLQRVTNASIETREFSPVWSPDGSQFAFTMQEDGQYSVILSLAKGIQQRDLRPSLYIWDWITADKLLLVRTTDDFHMELVLMDTQSGESRVLTENPSRDLAASGSPDGERIVYVDHTDELLDLYIRRTDGTDAQRLTTSEALEMFPSWSPDGTRILFASEQDGVMELYIVAVADGSLTRLTYNSATDWNPAWSPDGTRIVFASDRDGDAEIYVMNADGTNQQRLTFNPAVDAYPSWQP